MFLPPLVTVFVFLAPMVRVLCFGGAKADFSNQWLEFLRDFQSRDYVLPNEPVAICNQFVYFRLILAPMVRVLSAHAFPPAGPAIPLRILPAWRAAYTLNLWGHLATKAPGSSPPRARPSPRSSSKEAPAFSLFPYPQALCAWRAACI